MAIKVRKTFGEIPETVVVMTTQVAFDAKGEAEVEDEIAKVLFSIPGYIVENEVAEEEPEEDTSEEDEDSEEEPEEAELPKAPKRKAPARKAPTKK